MSGLGVLRRGGGRATKKAGLIVENDPRKLADCPKIPGETAGAWIH